MTVVSVPRDETPDAARAAWLSRLRVSALALEVIVVAASFALGTAPSSIPLVTGLLSLQLVSNGAGVWWMRSTPSLLKMACLLSVDLIAFTALLAVTGGATNPFSFLYLVFIALAAVILSMWQSIALVLLSILGFGSLIFFAPPSAHAGHGHAMQSHVLGMWIACSVGAIFVVFFLQRLKHVLTDRENEIARMREDHARSDRLAALGTLAAGAAHELSTPLSTIAVAARELIDIMGEDPAFEAIRPEADAIRGEVDRCRAVLEHLAADAGQDPSDSIVLVTPHALIDEALHIVRDRRRIAVRNTVDAAVQVRVPKRIVARALRGLMNNALAADTGEISVEVTSTSKTVAFSIRDAGAGMSKEVLARSSEPFFTTRAHGEGMGLGLFLAHNVAAQLGGALLIESLEGQGTRATFQIPIAVVQESDLSTRVSPDLASRPALAMAAPEPTEGRIL